jgi:ABC-type lipoprotein export system ATPase subunit
MRLAAKDMTLIYDDGDRVNTVFDNVSVGFDSGQVNVLLGPSGCGKSSLLFLLSLLRRPTSGSVWLDGVMLPTSADTSRLRYERFGLVFQQHFLIPYLTVLENVCLAREDVDLKPKAMELLEWLGIANMAKVRPYKLSGGERQRVAIARALVKDPPVILADEPTAWLDRDNAETVYSYLHDCCAHRVVVVATHDQALLVGDERVFTIADENIRDATDDMGAIRARRVRIPDGVRQVI